jgi:hypothetical protein
VFVHSVQTFRVPRFASYAWDLFSAFLSGESNSPASPEPAPAPSGHDHHSLAQSLNSGLVEITVDLSPLEAAYLVVSYRSLPPDAPFLDGRWDALTAGRGPPFQG